MPNINQYFKVAMGYPVAKLQAVMRGQDHSIPMIAAMAAFEVKGPLEIAAKAQEAQQKQSPVTIRDKLAHEGEEKNVPHYHIAVQFHNSCKFTTIKNRFPRANIQSKLYGDYEQITNYLKKFELVLRHEHGEYDVSQQGKRNDIDSWKDDLDAGMEFNDLRSKHWKLYGSSQFSKGLDANFNWFRPPKITDIKPDESFAFNKLTDFTRTICILGNPGIGKSEYAKWCLPNAIRITKLEQLLDVRDIQKRGIIFDDFDFRKFSREEQIHLLDNTLPVTLQVRYRNVYIPAHTPKIICCNFFPFNRDEAAFMRRICMMETNEVLYKCDSPPDLGAATVMPSRR